MARVTVEDCIDKVESPYELVLVAKERATQLNSGIEPSLERDDDKNTVIALREIGEGKISIKNLEDSAVDKLRKHHDESLSLEELEDETDDNFDKIYKGEVSKSGTAILPSKRMRMVSDKTLADSKKIDNDEKKEEEKNLSPAEKKTE